MRSEAERVAPITKDHKVDLAAEEAVARLEVQVSLAKVLTVVRGSVQTVAEEAEAVRVPSVKALLPVIWVGTVEPAWTYPSG
jgi:hypothetical protein